MSKTQLTLFSGDFKEDCIWEEICEILNIPKWSSKVTITVENVEYKLEKV